MCVPLSPGLRRSYSICMEWSKEFITDCEVKRNSMLSGGVPYDVTQSSVLVHPWCRYVTHLLSQF